MAAQGKTRFLTSLLTETQNIHAKALSNTHADTQHFGTLAKYFKNDTQYARHNKGVRNGVSGHIAYVLAV